MRNRQINAVLYAFCTLALGSLVFANPLISDPDTPTEFIFTEDNEDLKVARLKSLGDLEETLKSQPKNFQALMQKGKLLRELHNDAGAIQLYTKAIEINPNSSRGYKQRALTYLSTKQYKNAAADLDRAVALAPNDLSLLSVRPEVHSKCSLACYEKRDYLGAIKHMDVALIDLEKERTHNPTSLVSRLKIGLAYLQTAQAAERIRNIADAKRRNLEARKNFEFVVERNFGPQEVNIPFQTQARILLARANLGLKEPAKAIEVVEAINTKDLNKGDHVQVLMVKMRAYEQMSEVTKAAEIELKLEELGAGAYWNRAAKHHFPAEINNTRKKAPVDFRAEVNETKVGRP
ncbi:MAG TPA: tetratricopeptide repeat protein [Candidatus Melainabacteria bacterium]|jgi:hypothetical protein|nr:tetratricopeptide repeat protein [Candidatus Melainabacteria bacterium]